MSVKARVSHRSTGTKLPMALQCWLAAAAPGLCTASTHSPAGLTGQARRGMGTVRESFVFPLLWMPDVSICLQFGEGEIPRGAGGNGMEEAASYALSMATH